MIFVTRIAIVIAATLALACGDSRTCAPIAPHDAGACGQTFDLDYDPSSQTGCTFVSGSGTSDTCASLCGAPATCELITFTSVECTTSCGD